MHTHALYFALGIILLFAGCAAPAPQQTLAQQSQTSPTDEYTDFVATLRARGMAVEEKGVVKEPFFTVPSQKIVLNGTGFVHVFVFPTAQQAAAEASTISPEGTKFGPSTLSFTSPPHFYRKDALVVFYVGSDKGMHDVFTQLLGPQFAGA